MKEIKRVEVDEFWADSTIIEAGDFEEAEVAGVIEDKDLTDIYIDYIADRVKLGNRKLKVAVDTGNGAAGIFIQKFLNKLGIEFERYKERWNKLSRSIETVNKDVENIHITTDKISKRFESISSVDLKDKKYLE